MLYRNIMIYKNKVILLLYVLLCIHISNVRSQTVKIYSHKNADHETFDVTTIYRITNSSLKLNGNVNARINDLNSLSMNNIDYSVEVHSRTNAIGMPLGHINNSYYTVSQINVYEALSEGNLFSYKPFSKNWRKKQISLTGEDCTFDNSHYPTNYNSNQKCYNALEFIHENEFLPVYNSYKYSYYSFFTMYLTPDSEKCLTITYVHRKISLVNIVIKISDNNDSLIKSIELERNDDIRTLKILGLMNNQQYKLSLAMQINDYYNFYDHYYYSSKYRGFWFGLLRIAMCSNKDGEDVQKILITASKGNNLIPFNILGNEITNISNGGIGQCLNGGYQRYSKCICPPGFRGDHCETGCGPNAYGLDCEGYCSMRDDKMCRGIYMCTEYGCTCPPGLTGPFCNEDCISGKYGVDCNQFCSSNCRNGVCDQYTGNCSQGCSAGYIQPFCKDKYPILINPPQLLLTHYETLELQLNFKSDNIKGGNDNTTPKYYQLLYKSFGEEKYNNSKIKLINQYNNASSDIINNLEPYSMYSIGVLLITDDGNFNEQDIVYGQYKTSCLQPKNTDYNVKIISGIKSINITWNKIVKNSRSECNITGYIVTLMSNQSQNQITDVQEILSSSDSGHCIDDLLPGFHYNLKLTPMSVKGPLPSSPMYTITTFIQKNDAEIKNISTIIKNGKIQVHWSLVNTHHHYSTMNDPVTCIVRYKLTRILSCSLRELEVETDWSSITVSDKFSYEISDTVPNSQYSIQVITAVKNIETIEQENMIYVLTPELTPETEPIIDIDHPMLVTNKSVFLQWKVDPKNCSKLNGIFSNFYLELKDNDLNILKTEETEQSYIFVDDLRSNNSYDLKVFIKTHIGYNPNHFLFTSFTTKSEYLKSVDDLMVYKKSLKNHMVGLRWSYLENTNLNGFIVSFNDSDITNRYNYSVIPLIKCSAWPEYYCYTFYNLKPSNSYTFKIKPKSLDYPEAGQVSSISFNSNDGLPDPPSNIKINEVSNTTINIQWDIPWIFNGLLKMFIINAEEISALDMDTCCASVIPAEVIIDEELPTYNYTLIGLKPGSTYSMGIITVSKSLWYSSPARTSVATIKEEL